MTEGMTKGSHRLWDHLEITNRGGDEGEDEEWNGEGAREMAGGRWLAVDGRWPMGWQLAGGVNLVIPPGTAVRDAHACYEVVVLVTVPDKPRLAPCFLLLPLLPHCWLNRAIHTGAKHERNSTMWNCWRLRCMTI